MKPVRLMQLGLVALVVACARPAAGQVVQTSFYLMHPAIDDNDSRAVSTNAEGAGISLDGAAINPIDEQTVLLSDVAPALELIPSENEEQLRSPIPGADNLGRANVIDMASFQNASFTSVVEAADPNAGQVQLLTSSLDLPDYSADADQSAGVAVAPLYLTVPLLIILGCMACVLLWVWVNQPEPLPINPELDAFFPSEPMVDQPVKKKSKELFDFMPGRPSDLPEWARAAGLTRLPSDMPKLNDGNGKAKRRRPESPN